MPAYFSSHIMAIVILASNTLKTHNDPVSLIQSNYKNEKSIPKTFLLLCLKEKYDFVTQTDAIQNVQLP